MGRNNDTGNLLIRLIYMCMDHLMHNPKRATFILMAVFTGTLITGEVIGRTRITKNEIMPEVLNTPGTMDPSQIFDLKKIIDTGPVNLTPQTTPSQTPENTGTPISSRTEAVSICAEAVKAEIGRTAKISSSGYLPASLEIRYRWYDPYIITGEVAPGDIVVILDGPVCHLSDRWWKIRSGNIVGWMRESFDSVPVFDLL